MSLPKRAFDASTPSRGARAITFLASIWRVTAVASLFAFTGITMAAENSMSSKTVVLVHGAWADGSRWNKVIPLLQAKGLHVVAVQNPLSSLADDVATTNRVINMQKGSVILVGHPH